VAEQAKLDWNKLLEEALTAPGNLTGVYDRFYSYSFLNQIYLRMQGIHEPVATYKRRQAIGRHVLKGSKAREIIRPLLVDIENEEGEKEQRLLGFKGVRCIFPLSDTEGDPLPTVELPGWDTHTALDKLGIRQVPFDALDANLQGYSIGTEIALSPIAVHPEKTLIHELAHVILGHTIPHSLDEYRTHRGEKEFQAEATAYLTLNELGRLDDDTAAHSRGYISHWMKDEHPSDTAIRQVFTATDRILKAGRMAIAAE
jgi:hypothetical protein